MIPMSGINYVLAAEFWIAAFEPANYIRGGHAFYFAFQAQLTFQTELDWLKVSSCCLDSQSIEILSGKFHQPASGVVSHPGTELQEGHGTVSVAGNIKPPGAI